METPDTIGTLDYWKSNTNYRRLRFKQLLDRIKRGEELITTELMKSITRPDWKRELVEAICLSKVQPKEK